MRRLGTLGLLLALGCVHVPADEADAGGRRFAEADGWLAGTVRGFAPGPAVILVHGLGGNRHFFDAQISALEDRARVVAYDQRGCGESSLAPRKKYDLDSLVTDLSLLMDLGRVEKAVLVGHSFGADVVTRYAALHPERVAGLVLIDPPGDLHPELEKLDAELAADDDGAFRRRVDALTEQLLVGASPETRTAVLASVNGTPRVVLQRMIAGVASFDPATVMASYSGPITCLVTDHTMAGDGAPMPCRSVVRLHGVSHWPMLDEPASVTAAIEGMLPDDHHRG